METGESTRQKKVSKLIQKEVADYFLQAGREYAPGKMISVMRVRVSPDLSFAKVYVSIFPTDNVDDTIEAIKANTPKIRFFLGQKVKNQLRIVPELSFHRDDSLDYIDNINKLLSK